MDVAHQLLNRMSLHWRLLGDGAQNKWNGFLDIVGDDPETIWVAGTTILFICLYWATASIFTVMDITNKPKFLRKYKIESRPNEPFDKQKLFNAIKVVLFNQTFITIPFLYIGYHAFVKDRQIMCNIRELPTMKTAVVDITISAIVEEILFYYVHMLLHHKWVYKYIHSKHHEWDAPIAAAAIYCHPVEHFLSNVLPIAVSVGLMEMHITIAWLFISLGVLCAMGIHSGYSIPFFRNLIHLHDSHHARCNCNFGIFRWFDKVNGTFQDSCSSDKTISGPPQHKTAKSVVKNKNE